MTIPIVAVMALLVGASGERPAIVVQAPDSPVRVDRATILTTADGPPILLYDATNLTDESLDQFTVIAFIFDARHALKARQVAPARRTLEARSAKYSTMVLDGSPIDSTDVVVVGVNQAQRVDSDVWWRADLQAAAEAAAQRKNP
jgi:hypothetical protein